MIDIKLKDKALYIVGDHPLRARMASMAKGGTRRGHTQSTPVETGRPDGVAILEMVEAAWDGGARRDGVGAR